LDSADQGCIQVRGVKPPLFFENQYDHDSQRYSKKGHNEKRTKKIGTPPLQKKSWIRPWCCAPPVGVDLKFWTMAWTPLKLLVIIWGRFLGLP